MIKDNFINAPLGNFVSFIKICGADINDITLGEFCKICEDSIIDVIDEETYEDARRYDPIYIKNKIKEMRG